MRYLLPFLLLLSACSMSPKDLCEFQNGSRAFFGQSPKDCENLK